MTRRMQANKSVPYTSHGREHDEKKGCEIGTPCQPVARRMMGAPTMVSDHKGVHDENKGCHIGTPCTPVPDTVTVPGTGTYIVADGVTYTARKPTTARFKGKEVTWDIVTDRPGPSFFEVGKTYRRKVEWSIWAQVKNTYEVFRVTVVEEDRPGGPKVAFGRLIVEGTTTDKWLSMRQWDYDVDNKVGVGEWTETHER